MKCEEYNDICQDIRNRGDCKRPRCRKYVSGAPKSKNPRNVRKYVDWTQEEWTGVKRMAKEEGLSLRDLQRIKTLRPGKAVIDAKDS